MDDVSTPALMFNEHLVCIKSAKVPQGVFTELGVLLKIWDRIGIKEHPTVKFRENSIEYCVYRTLKFEERMIIKFEYDDRYQIWNLMAQKFLEDEFNKIKQQVTNFDLDVEKFTRELPLTRYKLG